MSLSQTDATLLLGAFTSLCVPFVYAWAKSNVLADWIKLVLVVLTCIVGGFLTAYSSGQLVSEESVIQNAAKIATPAAAIYIAIFRGLNLERVLFPRASLITEAQKSVANQIGMLSTQTITDAVDPTCSTSLHVQVHKVDVPSPTGVTPTAVDK